MQKAGTRGVQVTPRLLSLSPLCLDEKTVWRGGQGRGRRQELSLTNVCTAVMTGLLWQKLWVKLLSSFFFRELEKEI